MGWTVDGLDYTTRRKITIAAALIDNSLANFPLLVKLSAGNFDFAKANADGFDIRFTSDDGETLLKYERERHDQANSLAEYWVKVPAVDKDVDTDIYIYYRTDDTADGADPTNVWDANFVGVYHLKDDPNTATVQDSTSGNNDGAKLSANNPIQVDAKIAKGQEFSSDKIDVGDDPFDLATFSIECIFKTNTDARMSFFSKGAANIYQYALEIAAATGKLTIIAWSAAGSGLVSVESDSGYKDNAYHYVIGTIVTAGSPNAQLYIDGGAVKQAAGDAGAYVSGAAKALIGARGDGATYYTGIIDELRISNVVRPASYAKASYNSCFDLLNTYGGEETPPVAVGLSFGIVI